MPAVARSARSLSGAPGRFYAARRALVFGLPAILLNLLIGGCRARPAGALSLYFRISPEDLAGYSAVELDPDWAGASRHAHRDAGWRRIPMALDRVDLEAAASRAAASGPVEVASGRLPAGRYDRVLVSTPLALARRLDGDRQELTSHVEPIARGFDLGPGEAAHIVIDLIVRPAPAGLARPEIFVKRAELLESAPSVRGRDARR